MAGSLLALYQVSRPELFTNYKTRQLLSLGGFVLMIGSFVLISKDLVFPGWIVVFPVLGTTLLLASGKEALVNKTLLSSRLAVAIGLISYPMYLWHWPMLTLPRVFSGEMSVGAKFVALFLTLCFSIATYKFVEKPFRYGGSGGLKSLVLILCIAALGSFGLNDYQRDGLPFRSFVKTNTLPSGFAGGAGSTIQGFCGLDSETKKRFRFCLANTQELPQLALYGDSKAGALYPGLFRTSQEDGRWLFIGGNGSGGAPGSILTDTELQKPSDTLTSIAAEAIADNPSIKVVLLATATRSLFPRNGYEFDDAEPNFSRALHGMTNLVKRFTASGKKVVLLVDNPTFPEPADCLLRTSDLRWINSVLPPQQISRPECRLTLTRHIALTSRYRDLLLKLRNADPDKVYIFDTAPYLCDQTQDECYLEYQGKALYDDGDHLSDYASGLIGQPLNVFIQTLR